MACFLWFSPARASALVGCARVHAEGTTCSTNGEIVCLHPRIIPSMGPPADKDEHEHHVGGGRGQCHLPPPPASWPAAVRSTAKPNSNSNSTSSSSGANAARGGSSAQAAGGAVPPSSWWSGFDEEFEVHLPGRADTTFFVRVAGRELAATNGVAVVIHGVRDFLCRAAVRVRILQQ